ncbi:polysaccharide lyase family 7 protein [Rheinheimera baltica]|uniref:polysaccharide lyase family 7 protein n=1 Tax=Rheinheimera baltica TaxID=67576 RepID=UPI00273E4DE9|nr:polysaccharide lyase family 7 protein [Rheinheimera baltica]MDP5142899.1 polysaccharide lyase family 7 protein [Rheinheimera baltica]MDP5149431.1 polysaccharide lyase family 7 protein [Rheinheimera baltica]
MKTINCMLTLCLILLTVFVSYANESDETETHIIPPVSHQQLGQGVLLGSFTQLDPAKKPSENFDLLDWSLTLPTDLNKDKKADIVYERALADGFELKPLFYTAEDGGMVFACPNEGAKTSSNTKYARTELREMLRRGKTQIKTQGITKNNWVFRKVHGSVKRDAGAIEGSLEATLAVNRVSVTGDEKQVGRLIIGQIHATDDEPIRLYYRKLPNNEKGSIYFAHEINGGDDVWINMIGSRSHTLSDPEDGIRLNETFSYKITVENSVLFVTIIRPGKANITKSLDMSQSGYHSNNQYMYFKAGVYNQNNSGDPRDYVQATFYHLDNQHDG